MANKCRHLIGYIHKENSRLDCIPLPFEKIDDLVIKNSISIGREFQYEFLPTDRCHIIKIQCYGTLEQCGKIVNEIKNMLIDVDAVLVKQDWIISDPETLYREFKP